MDIENRPKLKIPKTKMEWLADGIGYLSLLSMFAILIMQWGLCQRRYPLILVQMAKWIAGVPNGSS